MSDPVQVGNPQDSGLVWRLKRSFVTYITRMPDGRISVTDGADVVDANSFRFGLLDRTGSALREQIRFVGDVRFAGHGGMLFVALADPVLVVDDQAGRLSVLVPATRREPAERIPFATASLTRSAEPGRTCYRAERVRLTDRGAALFGGVYPSGEPLDDFTVTVPAEPDATPGPPTEPPPSQQNGRSR